MAVRVENDDRATFVTLDHRRVPVLVRGNLDANEVHVSLPGYDMPLEMYAGQAGHVADRRGAVFIEAPVVGLAEAKAFGWRRMTLQDRLDWQWHLYEKLEIPSNSVWEGHSLGGGLQKALAAQHPGAFKALVLHAPNGNPKHMPVNQLWALMASMDVPKEFRSAVTDMAGVAMVRLAYMDPTLMLAMKLDTTAGDAEIGKQNTPTLLVGGDHDLAINRDNLLAQKALLGERAEVLVVPGAHWLGPFGFEKWWKGTDEFLERALTDRPYVPELGGISSPAEPALSRVI